MRAALIALALACLLPGCCSEVFFGAYVGPSTRSHVALVDPASTARPAVGEDGMYPTEACAALCQSVRGYAPVTSCSPLSVTVPPRDGVTVICDYDDHVLYKAPRDSGLTREGDEAHPDTDRDACIRVCGGGPPYAERCRMLSTPPPAVASDARFVACHYSQAGHCGQGSVYGARLCR